MENQYQIEKWIWNQNDFEQMGWHDNTIWAISFDDDIKFDLDYIFKWVHPGEGGGSFRFWISPATLIFRNPSKFKVEMQTDFVNGLEIADMDKLFLNGKTSYIIKAQEGRIEIQTDEFQQIIRRPPTLQISQSLTKMERGPISFSEIADTNYKPTEQEIKYRELSYRFDDLRTKKTQLQIEYDECNFNDLNSKDRILKKREFKKIIDNIIREVKVAEQEMNKAYEL